MTIDKKQLRHNFTEAKSRYKELQDIDIAMQFSNGLFFTMRAGIRFRSIFGKKRKYYIQVNLNRKNILSKLSREDVIGWFGHELAHIVDYETMSGNHLLVFILRYMIDTKFRFLVERKVNAFAFNNGFPEELFGVLKKFLLMDGVNKRYQKYIVRNYAPHWEDIRETAEGHGISREVYESFK